MPRKKATAPATMANRTGATLGFEDRLWAAADKLRGNMDAAEYKHVVLGLIFLKYISDAFMEKYRALEDEPHADPEDRDEYLADNIFWVPPEARWDYLQKNAKRAEIGKLVDDAMAAIERDNPALKGVLPKDFARPALDKARLGEIIDLIATIGLGDAESRQQDILGRVYEYFLARFAAAEGKLGGQFYTPQCVVKLLVEMIEPYKGRVFDPCCGSGGMFVSAVKFVQAHASGNGNGRRSRMRLQRNISIYGQESNYTTWRLALMNLAIRGIDAKIEWGDSFLDDKFKDLKADFILANPPFNMEDWGYSKVKEDVRWRRFDGSGYFALPPGGLVVDYLGIAEALKRALHTYTASGGQGQATIDQEQAVAVMMEKYEVVRDLLDGFDYRAILTSEPAQRMNGVVRAMEFILGLEDGKARYLQAVAALSKAFALAVPHQQALAIREEVGLFQEIRAALVKATVSEKERTPEELEAAVRQLVSRAVYSTEVVDIFAAAGLDKPDISILSDEFLAEVQRLPQRNLALELLKKLINDEIRTRLRKNVVLARSFAEMLEQAVRKYQNRALEAAQVIEELIRLAKELRKAQSRGQEMGLSDDEVAFYDALADNQSARQVMGDEKLRFLAQELVDRVRQSVTIDWQVRENARAQIRVLVKRILRKYGYPPDMQQRATELVLEQAEVLCGEWASM